MFSLFPFQALEKLDMEVLDFWLFIELSILEWFSTWFFKHARIPVRAYFQSPIALCSSSWPFSSVHHFKFIVGRLVVPREQSNKILPLSFSRIFIGFQVIVSSNCEQ